MSSADSVSRNWPGVPPPPLATDSFGGAMAVPAVQPLAPRQGSELQRRADWQRENAEEAGEAGATASGTRLRPGRACRIAGLRAAAHRHPTIGDRKGAIDLLSRVVGDRVRVSRCVVHAVTRHRNPSPSSQAQSTTGRASNRPPFRPGLMGAARTGHAELTSGRLVARRRASCPRPGAAGQHVTRQRLPPGRGVQGRTGADGTFGVCPTCLEPSGYPSGRGLVRCARRDQEASGMPGAYPVDLRRRVVAAMRPMRQDSRRAAEPAALRRPAFTSPPPVARIWNSPPGIRFRDPGRAGRLQAAFKVTGNGSGNGREPLSGSPPGSCRRGKSFGARAALPGTRYSSGPGTR